MEATRVKPTEIRIGNILKGGKVKEFNKTVVHFEATRKPKSVTYYGYQHINCKPIPLTEEWIEKFGFKFKTCIYNLKLNKVNIKVFFYDCWRVKIESDEYYIEYNGFPMVHEFQNMIALTGEELTLKY